ncbi:MAG: SpoIIE family protein phosphatase [Flavobacteriales bacterium]|nr:SpoIIE family protein phosphatase [Flavobacteriales bacterium]
MKKIISFLIISLIVSVLGIAQITTLPPKGKSEHMIKKALILEDENSEFQINDFLLETSPFSLQEYQSKIIQPKSDIPYMDFTTSSFWIKLEVENIENSDRIISIELARPLTNQVELFVLNHENEITEHFLSGDDYKFDSRPYQYRKFIFPVQFPQNSKRTLLVRTKSDGEILKLTMKFWDKQNLTEFVSKENFFLGFYYGFIALVVILFTFFGIALKDKIYFFFVSYVFIMGMFQLSLDGFSFEYLWPNSIYWANHSILVFAAISMLSLLAYANQFLEFYEEKKWFINTYRFFFSIVFLCLITSFSTGNLYEWSYPILNGVSFIITTFFFVGIYLKYKSGHKPGIEITFAFAFLWMGAIFFILSNVNIIESEFLASNSLKLASAVEIAFLSISLASRYRLTQDQKLEAERKSVERLEQINQLQNNQTETLEREVKLRTQEIVQQKNILENQNKEIIQSITYAQRLQEAILPSKKLMEALFVENAIFFRPKDIVSGDFYWLELTEAYVYFAVADCTGHGVPGAMVSVVGYNALNRCINEMKLTEPGKILDRLTDLVEHTFSKDDNEVSDGMDICLCRWDYKNELKYSGAYNSLYVIKNGALEELKANRQPIGKFIKRESFNTQTIHVDNGDAIFLFTDGFIDQFGGKKGKKLKSTAFKNILQNAHKNKMDQFEETLESEFTAWKGKEEQIDDVCVMTVKF